MMLHLKKLPTLIAFALLLIPATSVVSAAQEAELESVIIQTSGSLDDLRARIESAGGSVTQEFDKLNAVAAQLPAGAIPSLQASGTELAVVKDAPVSSPGRIEPFSRRGSESSTLQGGTNPALFDTDSIGSLGSTLIGNVSEFAEENPGSYLMNHSEDNVRALHAGGSEGSNKSGKSGKSDKSDKSDKSGKSNKDDSRDALTGDGIVVAVIDTGLRPSFVPFDLEATRVECEDFVFDLPPGPTPDPNMCEDNANDGHGTMVAGIIAAGAEFTFEPTSVFLNSVGVHAPGAALDLDENSTPETVAMIGSAPGAQIYAFRVFKNVGTSTSTSVIVAAIERILVLKSTTVPNLSVANFSLGTDTLNAGFSVLEMFADDLLEAGIVPVTSAGNAGPALMTTANPASAFSSVAVGAGSLAHQERIEADVFHCDFSLLPPATPCFNPATGFPLTPFPMGDRLRPSDFGQTAWFSSRGPNADGRDAPAIMADGTGVYGAGLGFMDTDVSLARGTSFSSPNVAGIAALLQEAFPGATATEVRNALVKSGNRRVIDDGSGKLDEGNGWVDTLEAYELLEDGEASNRLPRPPRTSPLVSQNIDQRVRSGNVRKRINNLEPGEREDIIYEVLPTYGQIEVAISDVSLRPNNCSPNEFFEDEIRLAVHTAKTSSSGPEGNYYDLNVSPFNKHAFISPSDPDTPGAGGVLPGACGDGTCTFLIDDPEPGLARISLSGAIENSCRMSARVEISNTPRPALGLTATGSTTDQCPVFFPGFSCAAVFMPSDVTTAEFRLAWNGDWAHYPTNDLDMFVFPPSSPPIASAFRDSPEVLTVSSPAGNDLWLVVVSAFEVNTGTDTWELQVTADGSVLPEFVFPPLP